MIKKLIFCLLAAIIFLACSQKESGDEAKLMALHNQQREAHLLKNAQAMVDQFADDLVQINHGKTSKSDKQKDREGFQRYFNSVEFKKWDDVTPPVIRFSDDHSLAYMLVDKIVVLDMADSLGGKVEETTHFAWLAVFRKQPDGNFKIECVASTNEPEKLRKL